MSGPYQSYEIQVSVASLAELQGIPSPAVDGAPVYVVQLGQAWYWVTALPAGVTSSADGSTGATPGKAGFWVSSFALGLGERSSLIFRPGEPNPASNVFASWAVLIAAAASIPAPKTIIFDDTLAAVNIPVGAWDFGAGCTFRGLLPAINSASPNRVQVTCPQGVTFTTPLYELSDVQITYSGTGALMTVPGDAKNRVFYMTRNARTSSTGVAGRIFDVPAGAVWTAVLFDISTILVAGGGLFSVAYAGTTQMSLRAVESGGTTGRVPANCLAGPAGPTYSIIADELTQIATAQAGMPGGVVAPTFVYGSPLLPYTPVTPANWAAAAPANVQDGIDRLAAAVFLLRGSVPIP